MIFYKRAIPGRSFAPEGTPPARGNGIAPAYELDGKRVAYALAFLAILIAAAIVARVIQWGEAAAAFLSLVQVAAGGLVGLFFGEASATKA